MFDYIVVGAEATGLGVVRELTKLGKRVVAIDSYKERIELLESEGFEAILADPTKPETYKDLMDGIEAILVLTSNDELNLETVKVLRSLSKDVFIVARVSSQKFKDDFKVAGANLVVFAPDVLKQYFIENVKRIEFYRKLEKFRKVLENLKDQKLGIFTHDNPDPDAISSALALKEIAEELGVQADILYYGEIQHQKNRAMVNLLQIKMLRANETDLSQYTKFALVDSSGPGINNSIPKEIKISIVIDHHPAENVEAEYVDVRDDVGSTATMLVEYLKELEITPSKNLATALFFGIKSETDDFKKNTKISDFQAAIYLLPYIDRELIEKIEQPSISTETLDVIGTAVKNREIYSSLLLSFAGFINDRDALPQAAELLLRLEGISTTLVYGIAKGYVYISARNKDVRINLGEVLRRAFGEVGSAGGHSHAAGAQIPLGIFEEVKEKEALAKLVTEAVKRKFLSVLGIEVP
ncbi:MAG: DHH family phosphoesterase [Archaeoglobaceae archaeon]|nr:DHH family phosphoesterase [Archaeoglobaceae archaeon]MCX8152122.1 DHH family phosphoesterase [Archaeoglobaceae archaeon]MDW8013558.1 DHH family phosphoesterase [Archaeoglobaceae archaeon]